MVTAVHKKMLSFVLVVSLIALMFTGCASSSTNGKDVSGTNNSKGESVELQWLVRSDPIANKWEQDLIKSFERTHQNIKVKLIIVPQNQIDQKIATMIASNQLPDVFSPNWANSGFVSYKDALLDLNPYVKEDPHVLDGFEPKTLDMWTVDGKLLAVSMSSLGSFLFYNKDLLDQAGVPYPTTNWDDPNWTWDKMVQAAQKLTHDIGNPSKQVYGLLDGMFPGNADARLFGGDYFTKDSYTTGKVKLTMNDPAIKQSIQAHYDLIYKYKVSPNTAQNTAITAVGDPFLTGKVAMVMTGGWGFWVYKPAKFHWGVAALPNVPGRRDVLFVDNMSISKNTKHPKEAWEFMKEIINPKGGLKDYIEATQSTPNHKDLMDMWLNNMSKALGQPIEQLKQVQDGAIKYGDESANHLIENYNSIHTVISQALGSVYDNKKNIDKALKEIESGINALQTNK